MGEDLGITLIPYDKTVQSDPILLYPFLLKRRSIFRIMTNDLCRHGPLHANATTLLRWECCCRRCLRLPLESSHRAPLLQRTVCNLQPSRAINLIRAVRQRSVLVDRGPSQQHPKRGIEILGPDLHASATIPTVPCRSMLDY